MSQIDVMTLKRTEVYTNNLQSLGLNTNIYDQDIARVIFQAQVNTQNLILILLLKG